MGFVNAATALIDDDQKDALHELFEATTDLGIRLVDKFVEHYDYIDGFTIHDDWGFAEISVLFRIYCNGNDRTLYEEDRRSYSFKGTNC